LPQPQKVVSVFLSYAHTDQKWAQELILQLSERGIDVWEASSKLSPGDNWPLEVGKALERAQAMIVLVSPAAARSPNVRREIEYALGSKRFRDRLIPIIVKKTDRIPWILHHLNPVKGGKPSEVSERVVRRLNASAASN
jgi:hypothetical protein